jgi:hypothetical protein
MQAVGFVDVRRPVKRPFMPMAGLARLENIDDDGPAPPLDWAAASAGVHASTRQAE